MNRRLSRDGAWEGDVLPNGAFVAAYPSGLLDTVWGAIQAPQRIRYPRLHPTFAQVSGQTQDSNRILRFQFGQPFVDEGPACGVLACAYWKNGKLEKVPSCVAPYFSLGIRYIEDPRIYTGTETREDPVRRIWEYTTLASSQGEIVVGQGGSGPHGEDPSVILFGGRRYLLEAGTHRVHQAHIQGDQLAIGFFDQTVPSRPFFVGHWLLVSDIASLPDITEGEVPPEDKMVIPQLLHDVCQRIYDAFPEDAHGDEEARRRNQERVVQQYKYELKKLFVPGMPPEENWQRWEWKSQHSNLSSPSKDSISYIPGDNISHGAHVDMWMFDCFNGDSREPNPAGHPGTFGKQYIIHVDPKNVLGEDPPPPDPIGTIDKIAADVAWIKAKLDQHFK